MCKNRGFCPIISQIPDINYTTEDPKDMENSVREARRLWNRSPDILLSKQFYCIFNKKSYIL